MERHVYSKHANLRDLYDTGVVETARQRTAVLNPAHLPSRSSHPRRRGFDLTTTQEAYFFQGKAAFTTQSKEHNKSKASTDETGNIETYLPHDIKSKTTRITLGPRRKRLDRLIEEFNGIWKGDKLPDVPKERRPFNYNLPRFNPWSPFRDGTDFKLANWFIRNRISDTAITDFFNSGIHNGKSSFRSPYSLYKLIDSVDPVLGTDNWLVGEADFKGDAKTAKQEFYYRPLESSIRNLMERPAFRDHMVYSPTKEFRIRSNGEKQRIYSEIHTADWWHEEQVSVSLPLVPPFKSHRRGCTGGFHRRLKDSVFSHLTDTLHLGLTSIRPNYRKATS